ncbi:hypothetical protein [Nonomuraea cavernae]|uniref:Uncharacterized protein n=1 Tax=Nonomuraea cavernae TaxID=2045107 RepID=A0A918DT53_9ACTN|nr:hypothetical protein [Nonomuraea cavernae]MCA2188774.1 hypothetical protein [Nonomuraea cavernae]GGO80999.1 hypothetical protein GCM10012289_68930 [Nonomuraea cavernae]
MQVNNYGPIKRQKYIENTYNSETQHVFLQLQASLDTLEQLIQQGSVEAGSGAQAARELRAGIEESPDQPTRRLMSAARRVRDLLTSGGAAAEDVRKAAEAVAAISAAVGVISG